MRLAHKFDLITPLSWCPTHKWFATQLMYNIHTGDLRLVDRMSGKTVWCSRRVKDA